MVGYAWVELFSFRRKSRATLTHPTRKTVLPVAILLLKQIEAAQCVAVGHHEQRRLLAARTMRDPVAVWQTENVLWAPAECLVADARGAVALDHAADRVAGRAIGHGLAVAVDLRQIAIHQLHGGAAVERIDV